MKPRYADIIIDISHEGLDRPFCYKIPEELMEDVQVGRCVKVPFGKGNRLKNGYVIGLKDSSDYDESKIKSIAEISEKTLSIEGKLIRLALWLKDRYSCTMLSALKTVMPVKEKIRERKGIIDTRDMIPAFQPIDKLEESQQKIVDDFTRSEDPFVCLLHGVTGSGKTEVYIRMAEEVIAKGKDVIVLVPEIALTYQTVARFSSYFQENIAILNSQLSKGEKYREFIKAREGKTHIMIGPRSALFAPFPNLGLIIIDEEHDSSYKSEKSPRYHARDVAIERARIEGASVVLGSATPSIESYYKATHGIYKLYSMTERISGAQLPEVNVVDLREELKAGNRSIISQALYDKLTEAFERKEQAMLFINRRGYNSFVSCRSCGSVIKCKNCDVSLSLHRGSKLICHYCGYTIPMPDGCPECKSRLIGGYGTGTEKLEQEIKKLFPDIKTLRMDRDTTMRKGAHGEIIKKFRQHEADCLVGTQMIVKGHDFPRVTVVGNILADLSLFDSDFESSERTFQLLTQAAGRAGRAGLPGSVVIQTYQPDHYAIECARMQDYKGFYEYEKSYRELLHYPPFYDLMAVLMVSEKEEALEAFSKNLADRIKALDIVDDAMSVTGPAQASIYRINNVYRRVIYVKCKSDGNIVNIQRECQKLVDDMTGGAGGDIDVQFDINPGQIL